MIGSILQIFACIFFICTKSPGSGLQRSKIKDEKDANLCTITKIPITNKTKKNNESSQSYLKSEICDGHVIFFQLCKFSKQQHIFLIFTHLVCQFTHLLFLLSETAETLLLSFNKGPKLLILIHLCINAFIKNRSMRLKIFQEELEM